MTQSVDMSSQNLENIKMSNDLEIQLSKKMKVLEGKEEVHQAQLALKKEAAEVEEAAQKKTKDKPDYEEQKKKESDGFKDQEKELVHKQENNA